MSIEEEWVKGVVLVVMLSRDNMASRDCGDADGSSSSGGGRGGGSSGGGIELYACAVECRKKFSHLLPLFGTKHGCWRKGFHW